MSLFSSYFQNAGWSLFAQKYTQISANALPGVFCLCIATSKDNSRRFVGQGLAIYERKIKEMSPALILIKRNHFFFSFPAQAHEYHLAFIELPNDVSDDQGFIYS